MPPNKSFNRPPPRASLRSAPAVAPVNSYNPVNGIQERVAASFKSQALMETLGAQLVSVADGEVQIELLFSAKLSQQRGYVHAGAIASILEAHVAMQH